MATGFRFETQILDCVLGGVSSIDTPYLNIRDKNEAYQFIAAYGYDMSDETHREQLWFAHRRAVALIEDELLEPGESIPKILHDPAQLKDLCDLLILASDRSPENRGIQKWACAILRVMHVYVHLRNDLFSAFSDEIQNQILTPFEQVISDDVLGDGLVLGRSADFEGIRLYKFEVKPFKTTASSVIKLLARSERVALTLLDKLGVRFVTRNIFDAFRVIRFLMDRHLVSYPHIIPDQSNNTLYPANLFIEVMQEMHTSLWDLSSSEIEPALIEQRLKERLEQASSRANFLEKPNEFSGRDYKFIKFINRKLVSVGVSSRDASTELIRPFRFFYPYEIQIVDNDTYVQNLTGPMAHNEYKARQRRRARERVLGMNSAESTANLLTTPSGAAAESLQVAQSRWKKR